MSINYALIAKENNVVLTEASIATGNFPVITRNILNKITRKDGNLAYTYGDKQYCIIIEGNLLYLCLIDLQYPRSRALEFLMEIKEIFLKRYSPENITESFGLSEFDSDLLEKINHYNQNKNNEKIQQFKDLAGSTVDIMNENLQVIVERGDKIMLLVKKTKDLSSETTMIKDRSKQLKDKARNEQIKRNIIIGIVCLGIIYILFI